MFGQIMVQQNKAISTHARAHAHTHTHTCTNATHTSFIDNSIRANEQRTVLCIAVFAALHCMFAKLNCSRGQLNEKQAVWSDTRCKDGRRGLDHR
jgi:hypothetical protein